MKCEYFNLCKLSKIKITMKSFRALEYIEPDLNKRRDCGPLGNNSTV